MPQAIRRVAVLIGTRPEAVKLMPVIRALRGARLEPLVFVTGQHRELLLPILQELEIQPTENLDLMQPSQDLGDLSARVLSGVGGLLRRHRPDLLLVQGDTTSVALGALAAFYQDIPVGHVEAGLRTFAPRNPFPEEMNRRLVACLAEYHFAPTAAARYNLRREGVPEEHIHVVGNTVIDTLFHAREHLVPRLPEDPWLTAATTAGRRLVLVTGHRRESFGPAFASFCEGVRDLAQAFPREVEIVYPVHLNPSVQAPVQAILSGQDNVRLLPPLSYLRFLQVLLRASLIITDSGGVQEEAAALGIPVLVTRNTCERMEGVDAGVSELVGPDRARIFQSGHALLSDPALYARRAVPTTVYGDGRASQRIAALLTGQEAAPWAQAA